MRSRALRIFYRALNFLRPPVRKVFLDPALVLNEIKGQTLVSQFNDLFYRLHGGGVSWRGSLVLKNPCDLWVAYELLERIRPRIVIEVGTAEGGSARWLTDMAMLLGLNTEVITIDINPKHRFRDENLHQIIGYSTEQHTVTQVQELMRRLMPDGLEPVLVFLDSDHSKENVLRELRLYSAFVTVGSYIVVEDTNINGHPSFSDHGPGPHEAVQDFLLENRNFVVDRSCEKYLVTFNPGGYLRRVS